ncbi:putative ATP-dependent endonuclease of OLD family [Peribacillus frigoritolerans]|uniref:ATP-binding protein n=1 Tax=Peribacillus frigoritolerans TaxID=450367 RepID=UPI00209F855F|nr:ATP-binding protein [Peribacillus frigoritolerans]MCP1495097.1 putative ATP-dependent endonuclease of OLD family [Peribacillus frigoritolerans]
MFINNIYIKKYGKLRDFEVEFKKMPNLHYNYSKNKLNLSVIVGENGTGKTSLLKFISEIFTSTEIENPYLIGYSIDSKDYEVSRVNPFIKGPSKIIISSYSVFEQFKTSSKKNNRNKVEIKENNFSNDLLKDEVEYVYAGPKKKFNITSLSSVYLPILIKYLFPVFKKESENQFSAIQELLKEIGYISLPLIEIKRMSIVKTLEKKTHEIEYNSYPHTLQEIINISYKMDEFHNYATRRIKTKFSTQRKKLLSLETLNDYPNGPMQWIEDAQKLEKVNINLIQDLYFPKNDELIPMVSFSSGELSMFFRFFKLIDTVTDSSIVLIDEPETHLHPRWIRKYIKIINDLFGQYDCHFIIATHSPLIVSDVPSECIVGLRQNDGVVESYSIQDQTLGISYEEILREAFQIDDFYGEFTGKINEKILDLLKDGEVDSAKQIYNKLGDSELKFDLFVKFKELKNRG